jgi:hypothetical protein
VPAAVPLRARFESAAARALAGLPEWLLRMLLGRPVVIDGQELHIEVQLGLKQESSSGRA